MNSYREVEVCPNFFIVGSQRSGTTLLRLVINNHSQVAIPTESTHFMPYLSDKKINSQKILSKKRKDSIARYLIKNSQFSKWNIPDDLVKNCCVGDITLKNIISCLYSKYAELQGKQFCGDKSPAFIRKLPVLSKAFPEAKFIYIIRDGRDTFLSLRKKNVIGSTSPALAAIEWVFKQSLVEKVLRKLPSQRIYRIRYEDLVVNPEEHIQRICHFLEVPFESSMLNFWRNSEKHIAKHHSDLIFKPIDPHNIKKWKSELSAEDNLKYCCFAGKTLQKFGYAVPQDNVSFDKKILWIFEILFHLPRRLSRIAYIALYMRIASRFGWNASTKLYD